MSKKVSIRTKIFFIVLVAIIPTIMITIYSSINFKNNHLIEKKTFLSNLCDGFVNEQRLIIKNSEEILLAISQTSSVHEKDYISLNKYFSDLMTVYPSYAVLLAADSNGIVVASGVNQTGYSIADRDYFKQAISTNKFTLGGFVISKSTGRPILPLALPVTDRKGNVIVLVATFDLENYYNELALSRLPVNSCLEIFDTAGLRLFSSITDNHSQTGQTVSFDLFNHVKSHTDMVARKVSIKGIDYLVSAGSITENNRSVYITIRTTWLLVKSEADKPAEQMLVVMLVSLLLAFGLSLWLARRLFVSRIENLTNHTKLLADGQTGIRSNLNNTYDEITDLMESFNSMAAALEERSLDNQQTLTEKENLLLELQQRISDNLQLLSSMVNLQIEHTSEENIRRALMTTHSRVMALALVYETIYRYSNIHFVDMQQFGNGLCEFLINLYADVGSEISCRVTGAEISLQIDKALPISLILNELVSNCILHAFPEGTQGVIQIVFERISTSMIGLHIIDNGIGFKGDIHGNDTFGFEMIEALAEQIHGLLTISSNPDGTDIEIRFPEH